MGTMVRSGLPSVRKSGVGSYPWSLHTSQSALTLFLTHTHTHPHTYSGQPQVSSGRQPGVCGREVLLGRVSLSPEVSCTLLLISPFLEVSQSLAHTGTMTSDRALHLASPEAAMEPEPYGRRTGLTGHADNQNPLFRNSIASSGHGLGHCETQTPGHTAAVLPCGNAVRVLHLQRATWWT